MPATLKRSRTRETKPLDPEVAEFRKAYNAEEQQPQPPLYQGAQRRTVTLWLPKAIIRRIESGKPGELSLILTQALAAYLAQPTADPPDDAEDWGSESEDDAEVVSDPSPEEIAAACQAMRAERKGGGTR